MRYCRAARGLGDLPHGDEGCDEEQGTRRDEGGPKRASLCDHADEDRPNDQAEIPRGAVQPYSGTFGSSRRKIAGQRRSRDGGQDGHQAE